MEEEEGSYVKRWKGAGQQEIGKGRQEVRKRVGREERRCEARGNNANFGGE